ncbi:MAG: polyphosphate kinase 1 [Bacteroidetes bacterium]|nr:polyphosphate kinase 1 [Bacteroidota bacterium]MCK5766646.1 polyphosphate kinase 1 [Bacteroidales bacterium]
MALKNSKFINREISWLDFNERVLQEAMDETTPLMDRIKFMGIYSNNRDEFFRVRVATQRRMLNYEIKNEISGKDTAEVLEEITMIVEKQELNFNKTWEDIKENLEKEKIYLLDEDKLTKEQGKFVHRFFSDKVRPILFPLMLENFSNLNALKDATIYLAIDLKSKNNKIKRQLALIAVPTDKISRFIILPGKGDKKYIILLDDVIRYCLKDIFSIFGFNSYEAYTIKFTRDAEMDIDNDVSKSFLELMSESIKQRKKGAPVRFVYDEKIPEVLLKSLMKKFNISKRDNVRAGGKYHNFKDFMSFPDMGRKDLKYPPSPPLLHKDLPPNKSIIGVIREKDIMLHYPYQSFHYIIDLLREASIDPNVMAIKMTFYRAAQGSGVMNALINAARNGKQVTVFMELQARFDEEANIYWTNRLQEEGVKIIQTIPGFKVHSKLLQIRRKENGKNVYYANISTGNFNESTAKVYADDSLLTGNQAITTEVNKVFHLFESKFIMPTFKNLIVAPFNIRTFFMKMLDNEIQNASEGKEAWAILKMNSISDKKIARKLYEVAGAGVDLKMIVRGICILDPGDPEIYDEIEAFSIVDKYLEHSRVFVFCNGGDNKYFIASADWMPRNFDHRVEVVCPILDKAIQQELMDMLQIQLKDNTQTRYLRRSNMNEYRKTNDSTPHRAQFEIYDYFKALL